MKPQSFNDRSPGTCRKTLEGYYAFFPAPLPPKLEVDWELMALISQADQAMGELSGAGQLLPNPHLLIRPYLRREAILSSRIEDTHAEMGQLALFEEEEDGVEDARTPDVREVANYVRALESGLQRVRELPISTRLIKELHATLLQEVRGGESSKTPGEFRRSQNWIGPKGCTLNEATFVPPPYDELDACLGEWEKFIHGESPEPILVKAALLHYQFEAIHPFLDGNGRIGRLLITLFLCERGCLSQPLLYLSGFFDETRDEYYRLLLAVSQQGAWREWIEYFLRGIRLQARRALLDTQKVLKQYETFRAKLKQGKRVPQEAARILDHVFANPFISIARHAERVGVSYQKAQRGVEFWIEEGLLREGTGQQRNRIYVANEILQIMAAPSLPVNAEPSPPESNHD
jgi:Fic family protein